MKKSIKKLTALSVIMMMAVSLLSACGGGSEGSAGSAEPNAGIRGIVFTAPDDWSAKGGSEGGYLFLEKEGSEFELTAMATNSEDLENEKKYDDSITTTDINEYFKIENEKKEKDLEKNNTERSDVTVCGTDGYYYKSETDKGVVSLYTTWILDDNIYTLSLRSLDGYDYEAEKYKDDAPVLSDDDVSMFETAVASAKAGDGDAFLKEVLATDSFEAVTFGVPEGYRVTTIGENYMMLKKDGSETDITVNITTKDDLKLIEDENGKHPESIEEEWNNRTEWLEDNEKREIAGYDGYLSENSAENGKCYGVEAAFLADGEIYNISMYSNAWDENGNIKDDAKELTKDDKAAFTEFVDSLKAK